MLNKLKKFNNIILLTAMIAFVCVLIFNIISWGQTHRPEGRGFLHLG